MVGRPEFTNETVVWSRTVCDVSMSVTCHEPEPALSTSTLMFHTVPPDRRVFSTVVRAVIASTLKKHMTNTCELLAVGMAR